eukprot:SAG11_NODE_1931_length_4044_cov_1.223517_5_plen_94_part_00
MLLPRGALRVPIESPYCGRARLSSLRFIPPPTFQVGESAEPNPETGKQGKEAWDSWSSNKEELFEPSLRFNRKKADKYFKEFMRSLADGERGA